MERTGCWWHWTPEWKTCRTSWSRTKLLKKAEFIHISLVFHQLPRLLRALGSPLVQTNTFYDLRAPPSFKNHFTERKGRWCENTARETHNRAKNMGAERGSAGIAKTKLLAPSRREERDKEGRNEKPRNARRERKKKKKKKKNFSSSQNLQVLYLQRQKKPQSRDK